MLLSQQNKTKKNNCLESLDTICTHIQLVQIKEYIKKK
jgi:hypothetical protein